MLKMRLSFKSTCTCTAEPLVIQLQPPSDSKNREITPRPWNSMAIAPWSCCMEFNGKFSMEFRRQKFHGTQLHS